jgi:hypothetical protein
MSEQRNKKRYYFSDLESGSKVLYFTKDGYNRLKSYLGRVEQGNDKDWRTPFFDKAPREDILNGWQHTLESIQDKWPTLLEFENNLREKVGPISIMKPWSERRDDLFAYFDCVKVQAQPISLEAINAVASEFAPLRGMRLRSQKNTVLKMKKSTNSGNPYFTKRKDVISETLPVELYYSSSGTLRNTYMTLSPSKEEWYAGAVVGWRGQEGGLSEDDVKQRVIWMFPFGVNISELQVYQPLIEGCQTLNLVPAWVSQDEVDSRMTKLMDTKGRDDLIICTDFTKFDQHFNYRLQDAAKAILESLLRDDNESKQWLNNTFPIKYDIPIITPDGVYHERHGMGSGSGGTNADETLAHRCLQYEAAIENRSKLNPNSMCLGDDGVLSYPNCSVDQVVSAYTKHGLEMNVSKQYADVKTAEYLRKWYNTDYRIEGICRGVYST